MPSSAVDCKCENGKKQSIFESIFHKYIFHAIINFDYCSSYSLCSMNYNCIAQEKRQSLRSENIFNKHSSEALQNFSTAMLWLLPHLIWTKKRRENYLITIKVASCLLIVNVWFCRIKGAPLRNAMFYDGLETAQKHKL